MRSTKILSTIGVAAALTLGGCAAWPGSNLFQVPAGPVTPTTAVPATSAPTNSVPAGSKRIWALGDSQGGQYTVPERGEPWTTRIGNDVGNGADTMWGAGWIRPATHVNRTVPQRAADLAATYEIDQFIAMVGVNDLGSYRTSAEMLAGVDQLEAIAAAEGARVQYVAVVPFPQYAQIAVRDAERRTFNAALAQRFPGRYVDCAPSLSTAGGWLKPEYSMSPVDLHLNSAGQQALANCIIAAR